MRGNAIACLDGAHQGVMYGNGMQLCSVCLTESLKHTVTSLGDNTGNDVGFRTAAANRLLNGLSSLCRCKTSLKGIDSNDYLHTAKIQKEYDICNNNGIQLLYRVSSLMYKN